MKRHFAPDHCAAALADVDFRARVAAGKRLALLDVDNTLQPHGRDALGTEALGALRRLADCGLGLALISNARPARSADWERQAAAAGLRLRVYAAAGKPDPAALLRACADAGCTPAEALMVGDQLFTDMRAGKRAGAETIWLRPLAPKEPWYIKLKRMGEALLRGLLGLNFGADRAPGRGALSKEEDGYGKDSA